MKFTLRPYQIKGKTFLKTIKRAYLGDDMGLGKTLTSLDCVNDLTTCTSDYKRNRQVTVIFCPTFAIGVWEDEIKKWFNKGTLIYTGATTIAKRKKLWNRFIEEDIPFMIATYGMLSELMNQGLHNLCHVIIADEIHTAGLLNHKSKTHVAFKAFAKDCQNVYLMTGTPIRQGCIDLFAPLNILYPKAFPSYWGFVNRFCITIDGPFGKEIERRPNNVEQFREMLSRYFLRRDKSEVLQDLPGKQRQLLYIDMTPAQAKWYKSMLEEMLILEGETLILSPNAMTVLLRLRQLLVCPKLLGLDDYGAALENLGEIADSMLNQQEPDPFVVFTPFRQALPFIQEYLSKKVQGIIFYQISGGLTAEEFSERWQGFLNSKNQKKVLICVIKSGASFQAVNACNAFFLGYEWDFNQNIQSEDRLYRMGQKRFVNINYFMHRDTVDEEVAQALNDKQDASNWVIGNDEQLYMLKKRYGIKK